MNLALEDQLLLQCSRVQLSDSAITSAANLIKQKPDWDYVLEASIRHGVSPLFYHGLKQITQAKALDKPLPQAIINELGDLYQGNHARNLRLYQAVGDICKAFQRVGIQAMGLKDFQLVWQVYPDVGLRPMGDIDILIHPQDYDQAIACMLEQGFNMLPHTDLPFARKYAWAHDFQRLADNVWVDLQWGVMQLEWDIAGEGSFDFQANRMWQGAELMTVNDYQIMVPNPEDMLFHLCIHLEGHRYAELVLFCDIAALIRHYPDLDWEYFFGLAKKYRVESSIYYVLLLTQKLLGCPLPTSLEEIKPNYFKANIFAPLFGNLVTLHDFLDEIHFSAAPPKSVMSRFESTTRQQAAFAMHAYKEIDQLVTEMKNLGVQTAILEGKASSRVFPSQSLEPFADVRLFILDQDIEHLRQALAACEFAVSAQSYTKICRFKSADPAIGEQPLELIIQAQMTPGLDSVLNNDSPVWSKKSQALKALRGAFGQDSNDAPICLNITVLNPTEMLLYMASRPGEREFERLFASCNLLEFLNNYQGTIDWAEVAKQATKHNLTHQIYIGLSIASELADSDISLQDLSLFDTQFPPPFILRWARYGPAALDRYTNFKALFFYAFAFLSTPSLKEKLKYLFSPSPYPGRVILACAGQAIRLFSALLVNRFQTKQTLTTRDLAYWIEPKPVSPTTNQQ